MRKATTLLTILASLFFYAFALSTPASADPDGPGNNGTVKIVNDQGDGQDDPDNDPHVCLFHIYGFHFDDNSRGTWRIEAWAPGGGPLTATQSSGTWQANGIGSFDAKPMAQPFPGGHYKLFVKETFDPKRQSATPGGDKQKVFWVKCASNAPTSPTPTPVVGGTTTTNTGGTVTTTGGTTSTSGDTKTTTGGTTTIVGGTTTTTTSNGTTSTTTGGTTTIVGGTTTVNGAGMTNVGGTPSTTGGTAVRGFESAPNGIGSVSPIVEVPGGSDQQAPNGLQAGVQNGTVAGVQNGPVAGVQSLPATSTDRTAVIPLAAMGLAIMALGGILLRRRDPQL